MRPFLLLRRGGQPLIVPILPLSGPLFGSSGLRHRSTRSESGSIGIFGTVKGIIGPVGGNIGTVNGIMGPVGGNFGTVNGIMGPVGGNFGTVNGIMGPVSGLFGPVGLWVSP
ncbi:hypothetical protein W823_10535 [Williamsia sp. D3]|nr:hypothetical protein W823_10535 [Williamsia sp. D3]